MSNRINWTRARPGRGGADERIGGDWRNGPRQEHSDLSGDAAIQPPDYLALPDIYWAAKLGKAFPDNDEVGNARLKKAASAAASRIYNSHGINTLLSRSLVFYQRASSSNPFPSAYFAAYFDFAAMNIALSRTARHDPPPRRNLKNFYGYGNVQFRCSACSGKMLKDEGGFRAFADRILGISGERLTTRGFPGI